MRWLKSRVTHSSKREASFQGGSIEDGAATSLIVAFSRPITATGNDYTTGVTVTVAGSGRTVNSGTLQSDGRTVVYVLASAVTADQAVTWAYNGGTGAIKTAATGNALATIAAQSIANRVGAILGGVFRFNAAVNSGQMWNAGF